jgi:hypothetical protein
VVIDTPEHNETNVIISARVESLLKSMTLAEKIGQMTQVDKRAMQPSEVTRWFFGPRAVALSSGI